MVRMYGIAGEHVLKDSPRISRTERRETGVERARLQGSEIFWNFEPRHFEPLIAPCPAYRALLVRHSVALADFFSISATGFDR